MRSGENLFVILWRRGPSWVPEKPITEQDLGRHRAYFADLTSQGLIVLAGPFLDNASGGMAVLRVTDLDAAKRIMREDPAIAERVFEGEVRPFHTVFA